MQSATWQLLPRLCGATLLNYACSHAADWSAANPAATDNRPDCELNIVTAPRQFFGWPYCATGPAGGDPNARPYLRRPGATSVPDPDLNAGEKVMNCTGELGLCVALLAWLVLHCTEVEAAWSAAALCCLAHECDCTCAGPRCSAAGANLQFTPAIQALGPHVSPLGMVRPGRTYNPVGMLCASWWQVLLHTGALPTLCCSAAKSPFCQRSASTAGPPELASLSSSTETFLLPRYGAACEHVLPAGYAVHAVHV